MSRDDPAGLPTSTAWPPLSPLLAREQHPLSLHPVCSHGDLEARCRQRPHRVRTTGHSVSQCDAGSGLGPIGLGLDRAGPAPERAFCEPAADRSESPRRGQWAERSGAPRRSREKRSILTESDVGAWPPGRPVQASRPAPGSHCREPAHRGPSRHLSSGCSRTSARQVWAEPMAGLSWW